MDVWQCAIECGEQIFLDDYFWLIIKQGVYFIWVDYLKVILYNLNSSSTIYYIYGELWKNGSMTSHTISKHKLRGYLKLFEDNLRM